MDDRVTNDNDLEEPGEVVPIHEDHIVVSSVSVHPRFRLSRFEICIMHLNLGLLNGLGKGKVLPLTK